MGNDASLLSHYDIARFYRKQDWLKIAAKPQHELWKHKFTHQTAEVYLLHQPPSIQDMDSFEFRSKQPELVRVFFIDANQEFPTCNITSTIKLLVEHIPYRLTDVQYLSQEQALTTLETAIKGLRVIQKRFQPVEPKEELIGFNEQGKPKVWLNKQWQLNTIEPQQQQFGNKYNQAIRIHKLFHIIQQKTVGNFFPHNLKQQFLSSTINYDEALTCLRRFAYTHALSLSSYYDKAGEGGENRTKTKTVHFRHTRQATQEDYLKEQKSPLLPNETKSGKELQKTISATNIHRRVDNNQTVAPLSSSQSFYRMQFPSADYSFSHNVKSSSIIPHPKINFVNSTTPNRIINIHEKTTENNEQSQRKYTIIDKIQVEFLCEQKKIEKEEKSKISPIIQIQSADEKGKAEEKEKKQERKREKDVHQKQKKPEKLESVLNKSQSFKIVRVQSLCETILLNQSQDLKQTEITKKKKEEKVHNIPPISKETHKSHHKEEQDFLDINFLEKSLERFKDPDNSPLSPKSPYTPHKVHDFEQDMLNIDKLEEGLMKFEKSQKNVHKDLDNLHQKHESFDNKLKSIEKQIESNQEITFKCIQQAEHHFEEKKQKHHQQTQIKEALDYQIPPPTEKHHKIPVEEIDLSKAYLHHSQSYDPQHLYSSYRTQASFNEYSSLSYEPHIKRTSFERSYLHDTANIKHPIWSAQQLPQNQTKRTHKKSSHIDIQQKYLKHVKNKERHFKPSSSSLSHPSQGQDLFSHRQTKNDRKESSKITYDELRSFLRTDL